MDVSDMTEVFGRRTGDCSGYREKKNNLLWEQRRVAALSYLTRCQSPCFQSLPGPGLISAPSAAQTRSFPTSKQLKSGKFIPSGVELFVLFGSWMSNLKIVCSSISPKSNELQSLGFVTFIFIIPFHGTLTIMIHRPDRRINVGIISTNYKHVETFLTAPEVLAQKPQRSRFGFSFVATNS